jgi:hypothetical protein
MTGREQATTTTTPHRTPQLTSSKPQSYELAKDLIAGFAGLEVDKLM